VAGTPFDTWLQALEDRHLADLTPSEVARALRAVSSCYVERRARLQEGAVLATRGKRAAFALFYGPLHFLIVREIVRHVPDARTAMPMVIDLGSGTGAAGASWALESQTARITGLERHPWAAAETTWTYAQLGLHGRARQADFTRDPWRAAPGAGILAAYAMNEVAPDRRSRMLDALLREHERGARVLVVEPIARRIAPWWTEWQHAFERRGGRSDDWRLPVSLPDRQRSLARAAGLDPQMLTARSLWLR
jgi:hypothetical protein